MINPFKYTHQIIEYKNADGVTKFVPRYSSLFWDLISKIEKHLEIYISCGGELSSWQYHFPSLEGAKEAIENHKLEKEKEKNSQYKKTAIHYVE